MRRRSVGEEGDGKCSVRFPSGQALGGWALEGGRAHGAPSGPCGIQATGWLLAVLAAS